MRKPRRKNPRTLLVERTRGLKLAAESISRAMTFNASRDVYIGREEREQTGNDAWHRPRKPEEHADNRPELWLEARRELVWMSQQIADTDVLLRYKLATFGLHYNTQVGVKEAMARLSTSDYSALVRLGVLLEDDA
jgi:hypothetical protein